MQIAVLGCAHPHVAGVESYLPKTCEPISVKHVYDRMVDRATHYAGRLNAQVQNDLEQILSDSDVRAVMIFSETDEHDALIDAAIDAGKHIYVDKPLALTAAGAWRLASRLGQTDRLFHTGFVLRRRSHYQFLKQQIAAGTFGQITRIRHTNGNRTALEGMFDRPHLQWFTQPARSGGGGLLDEGVHSIDMLLWLTGATPTSVTAMSGNLTDHDSDCETFGQALIQLDNGAIATVSGSWVDPVKAITLEISGTTGAAWVVADKTLYIQSELLEGADGQSPWTQLPPAGPHPQLVFLNALCDENSGELTTPAEAAQAASVAACMMQSVRERRSIDVPARKDERTDMKPDIKDATNNPTRVVLHGCGGRGAGFWLARLTKRNDVQVVGVCDLTEQMCNHALDAHLPDGYKRPAVFTDPSAMYEKFQPDASFIVTVHGLHYEHVKLALNHNCHVSVEKPLATLTEHAHELYELATAKDRLLQVAFNFPYSQRSSGVREQILDGKYGRVQAINAVICQPWMSMHRNTWRMDPQLSGGGMLYDTGTHLLQAVLYLSSAEPVEVFASIDHLDCPVDINGSVLIRFADGSSADVTIIGNAPAACRINVLLDRATMQFTSLHGHDVTINDDTGREMELEPIDRSKRHDDNFLGAIRKQEPLRTTAIDGVRVCELLDAICESARLRQPVAMPAPLPNAVAMTGA